MKQGSDSKDPSFYSLGVIARRLGSYPIDDRPIYGAPTEVLFPDTPEGRAARQAFGPEGRAAFLSASKKKET